MLGRYVTHLTDEAESQVISLLKLFLQLFVGMMIVGFGTLAEAMPIKEAQIVELIAREAALRHQVPKHDVEVVWADNKLTALLTAIPKGSVSMEIAQTARLAGKGNVPVQILVDGRKFRTIFPKVEIRVYQQVLVAQQTIARGSSLAPGDVATERKAVLSGFAQPLTTLDGLAGAVATRDIPEGTPLSSQMFKIPPVVKMGKVVSVLLTVGDLTIITTGEARSNGTVGQVIRVLNPDSKREFTARVVGPDRVEIKLED